jgi:hypothetical protein
MISNHYEIQDIEIFQDVLVNKHYHNVDEFCDIPYNRDEERKESKTVGRDDFGVA